MPSVPAVRKAPDQLGRSLRMAPNGAKMCYERALKRKPRLSGRIAVRVDLSSTGAVTEATIDSDNINDPNINACVRATMGRERFPTPAGGAARVVVPFVFQSTRQ